jgi:hypothetical protein
MGADPVVKARLENGKSPDRRANARMSILRSEKRSIGDIYIAVRLANSARGQFRVHQHFKGCIASVRRGKRACPYSVK